MIVYLQWALAVPEGWQQWDVTGNAQIRNAAKKAEPVGGEVLDQSPGWLVAANIQGVTVSGWDHVALEHEKVGQGQSAEDKLTMTCWNDDPDDWPVGNRWGAQWTFLPTALDNSPDIVRIFGQPIMNTRQTVQHYADANGEIANRWDSIGQPYEPFENLPAVDSRNVFHGIWVEQATWDQHVALQTLHIWTEWVGD